MRFSKSVVDNYKKIIATNMDSPMAQKRQKLNVDTPRKDIPISKEIFWEKLALGILTSVSQNNDNLREMINDLKIKDYKFMKNQKDIAGQVKKLKIRCPNKEVKAQSIATNMEIVEKNWEETKKHLETLRYETNLDKERAVAAYLEDTYDQIGLKQSRNIIQMLGLSRYVVPLDSRLKAVIEKYKGIEMPPQKNPYSSKKGYCDIENQLNELCAEIKVYPCILDACIFASGEKA